MDFFKSYVAEDGRFLCVSYVEGVYATTEIKEAEMEKIREKHTIWETVAEARKEIELFKEAGF